MAGKARKIAAGVAGFLFVALLSGALVLQSSKVQTRIADKFLSKLTENLQGRISFSSVKVMPTGSFIIKDLAIIDTAPYIDHDKQRAHPPVDTLFKAKTIAATFTLKGLFASEGLHLRRLSIDKATFHLTDNPDGSKKMNNLQRMFNLPGPKEVPVETGNIFDARKVRATDLEYFMTLYKSTSDWNEPCLHMADFHVTSRILEGHAVRFTKGRLSAVLDRMEFREENIGLDVKSMTGRCKVGMGKTIVEDFHIADAWSDINFEIYTMDYRNAYAFRRFTDEVRIGCTFRESVASARTVAILTGGFKGSDLLTEIKGGRFEGFVNDFSLKNLILHDRPSGVDITMDVTAKGITEPRKANLTADIKDARFTTPQLAHIISGFAGEKAKTISRYAPEEHFRLSGSAKGIIDHIDAAFALRTAESEADVSATVANLLSRPDSLHISGKVVTEDVDASLYTGSDVLRQVSMSAKVNALLKKDDPRISVDSLMIGRLNFQGNDFGDIRADGTLAGGTLKAKVTSGDPKLKLSLDGRYDLKPHRGYKAYKLNGDIYQADLKALGIDRREGPSMASAHIFADFLGNSGSLLGDAEIGGVKLVNKAGTHDIGDLMIGAHMYEGRQGINFNSRFADASYTGSRSVTRLFSDIKRLILPQALPSLYKADGTEDQGCGDCEVGLNFHDSRDLMSFIKPGIYIADSTRVSIAVDDGKLSGGIISPRLAFGSKNIKDTRISFDNNDGALNASVTGSKVSTGSISLNSPILTASALDDRLSMNFHYEGLQEYDEDNEGSVNLEGMLMRDSSDTLAIRIESRDSFIKIEGEVWDLQDAGVTIRGDRTEVDRLAITSGEKKIQFEGGLAKSSADTLQVSIEKFDLSILDDILQKEYGFEGVANGLAMVRSPFGEDLGLLMNFGCDSLRIGGADAGTIRMAGKWDDISHTLGVSLRNVVKEKEALYAHLSYNPDSKGIEANAKLDGFALQAAAPFLSSVFSEIGGGLDGEIDVNGKLGGDLRMQSRDVRLNDVKLKVAYTGVPYTLDGPVRINSDGVFFDNISVKDGSSGSGTLKGELRHSQLKHIRLNAGINFDNLLVMDTATPTDGGPYGRFRASGNATMSGPFEALQIDANVATSGEGNIHVGMSGALSSSGPGTLLTFVEKEKPKDPYDEMLMQYKPEHKAASDLSARAKLTVNPGLKAYVEIDKEAGNIISFNGNGNVNLELRPSKDEANLNGDYRINEGNYTFALPGIFRRDFVIKNGSSVKFSGDLSQSDLDISTIHNVKTSLSTLISDSTVVATRHLVECGIGITGKLNNPEIGFSINVPDLDPTTRSLVESALNTEDKVQRQFVALLLMGSFLPNEASGIFNGTNMLYSNAADIVSNQLSNILQKLEIPLDLGFDYQGLQSGTSIFDVAISTELFNNRVVVNGSLGNRRYSTSTNPNGDMVGDLDIQVKLDQPGSVRLSVFSHSADEYTSYLDYSQRNGVGLSYQKEFNKYRDFFRSLFVPKSKRNQKTVSGPANAKEDIIIKINNGKAVSDTVAAGR